MAEYVRTEKTIKQVRYELPSPSNYVELAKATNAAGRSFEQAHGRAATYDDDIKVSAEDDLVVVWFEVTI